MCKGIRSFPRQRLAQYAAQCLQIGMWQAYLLVDQRMKNAIDGRPFRPKERRWLVELEGDFFFVRSQQIQEAISRGANKVNYLEKNQRLITYLSRLLEGDTLIRMVFTSPKPEPRTDAEGSRETRQKTPCIRRRPVRLLQLVGGFSE